MYYFDDISDRGVASDRVQFLAHCNLLIVGSIDTVHLFGYSFPAALNYDQR